MIFWDRPCKYGHAPLQAIAVQMPDYARALFPYQLDASNFVAPMSKCDYSIRRDALAGLAWMAAMACVHHELRLGSRVVGHAGEWRGWSLTSTHCDEVPQRWRREPLCELARIFNFRNNLFYSLSKKRMIPDAMVTLIVVVRWQRVNGSSPKTIKGAGCVVNNTPVVDNCSDVQNQRVHFLTAFKTYLAVRCSPVSPAPNWAAHCVGTMPPYS